MKKLNVRLSWSETNWMPVGQLAEVDQRIFFEFDPAFLASGMEVSPFKWAARPGLIEHGDREFGPLPGWIDDSLPDGWGLLLMDRMFRKRGLSPENISPLDRLSFLGTRTMGALTYHPPQAPEQDPELIDLHKLGSEAQLVYSGKSTRILPALLRVGGSPAGARPKALIGVRGERIISGEGHLPRGFEPWIVKFAARADVRDAGPMEFAYALMARAAGINMPRTRLFAVRKGVSYFGVRRFDRGPQNARLHVHTLANLLHADFRLPSTDYLDLLKVTISLTRNHQDLLRAFRQMVFNIAACNRDDHAKNFAFVMSQAGEWRLSPAYDLSFSPGPGGEHTMSVMGEGKSPGREHVLQVARELGIKTAESAYAIDAVNRAVDRWPDFADEAGCTKKTTRLIRSRLRSL